MPSPFPGMDPYLESPEWFPGFHQGFIVFLQEQLQPKLSRPYYAMTEQRVWIETSRRHVLPDTVVLRPREPGREPGRPSAGGGTALAAPPTEPVTVTVPSEEFHELYLEIYTEAEGAGNRLVTSIELLSLANKRIGENNREHYLKKQREMLSSRVNLVEIDLLRAGEHATAVPLPMAAAQCGPFDYHVCIHRFDRPDDYLVYPIQLHARLPQIDVPLLPEDGTVSLDLQAVLTRAYDIGPYERLIRYLEQPPQPPLPPERAAWAEQWLKQTLGGFASEESR